jgi:hypothetical protein
MAAWCCVEEESPQVQEDFTGHSKLNLRLGQAASGETIEFFFHIHIELLFKAAGTAQQCFTSDMLNNKSDTAEDEHLVKWAAASLYAGLSAQFHTLKAL